MRRFSFLSCTRCRHFRPKRVLPGVEGFVASAVVVGFCTAGGGVETILWPGLEEAVREAGSCPDRDPPRVAPRCALFDLTAASCSLGYPGCCVYAGSRCCPFPGSPGG